MKGFTSVCLVCLKTGYFRSNLQLKREFLLKLEMYGLFFFYHYQSLQKKKTHFLVAFSSRERIMQVLHWLICSWYTLVLISHSKPWFEHFSHQWFDLWLTDWIHTNLLKIKTKSKAAILGGSKNDIKKGSKVHKWVFKWGSFMIGFSSLDLASSKVCSGPN